MKRVTFFIPGILDFPGDHTNWDGRAVTWTQRREIAFAERMDYLALVLTRWLFHRARVRRLFRMLEFYHGFDISLVSHSNGAHIVVDLFRFSNDIPKVSSIHLVCAACEADFIRNGLNRLLVNGQVERVAVYSAGKDRALALAHTLPGRVLGYGTLGLSGPLNVLPSVLNKVSLVKWDDYGHSTCWEDSHFDNTMANFT
jgi:hypothetical protein